MNLQDRIKRIQEVVGVTADGVFGGGTADAVLNYLRKQDEKEVDKAWRLFKAFNPSSQVNFETFKEGQRLITYLDILEAARNILKDEK